MPEVLMALEVQDGIHWTPFVEGCIAQEMDRYSRLTL
jgi:hypothetical protein